MTHLDQFLNALYKGCMNMFSGEYVEVSDAAGYSHHHTLVFLDGVLVPRSW